jgi:hypothetical protein
MNGLAEIRLGGASVRRLSKSNPWLSWRSFPPALVTALVVFWSANAALAAARAPVEYGIDRSNMGTQWTLAWPQEPNVSPFLAAEYNKPGNFEARRVAVLDGIARIHAQWFRDGFGKGPPELFVDLVHLVHARGMKLLAVFGAAASGAPTPRARSIWMPTRNASRRNLRL